MKQFRTSDEMEEIKLYYQMKQGKLQKIIECEYQLWNNSCRLIRKNSLQVYKHQDRYIEFLESLYDDLNITPTPRQNRLPQSPTMQQFKALPEFLAIRLKKTVDKAKESIFSIFYNVPLQIDMTSFRRNVAEQNRLQVASICQLISIVDIYELYRSAATTISTINDLRAVFNRSLNEQFLSYYQLIVKLQVPVENLLLEFFIIKEFKRRKPIWPGEDPELVDQIQNEFTKKTFYYIIKQYLEEEGSKLEQEICRICQQSIKIQDIQEHIEVCKMEHEAKQLLRSCEKDIFVILEEIKNQPQEELPIYTKILSFFSNIISNDQISFDSMKGQHFNQSREMIKELNNEQEQNHLLQRLKNVFLKIFPDISLSQSSEVRSDNPCINILPPLSPQLSFKTFETDKKKKPETNKISQLVLEFIDSEQQNRSQYKSNENSCKFLNIRNEFQESAKHLRVVDNIAVQQTSAHYLNVKTEDRSKRVKRIKSLNGSRNEFDTVSLQSAQQNQKKIAFKDFKVIKMLGKGAFGKVYLVQRRLTKDLYAMKTIQLNNDFNKEKLQDLITEHEIFKKIGGEHLVKASFSFTEGGAHFFFLEYMEGGDFAQLLQKQVYFTQDIAKYYIAQIVLAIEHLHAFGIVHRDLKPGNIVIDEDGHLKLTDFGLSFDTSQSKNLELSRVVGTPDYMPPEVLNNCDSAKSVADWWSLGVIIYQILIGVRPFGGQSVEEVFSNILGHKIELPEIGYDQGMVTPEAKNLIQSFLETDPSKRLGINGTPQIKSHPFFVGVNWESIKKQSCKFQQEDRAKIKVEEDPNLAQQIQRLIKKSVLNVQFKLLDDMVRFDILSEATIKSSEKVRRKNSRRLTQLSQLSKTLEKHFA